MIFSFELPLIGVMQSDLGSVTVSQLEEKFNVKVLFRTRARLHATLVMVKGCEWELAKVKEATLLLMKHLCHDMTVSTKVSLHCSGSNAIRFGSKRGIKIFFISNLFQEIFQNPVYINKTHLQVDKHLSFF